MKYLRRDMDKVRKIQGWSWGSPLYEGINHMQSCCTSTLNFLTYRHALSQFMTLATTVRTSDPSPVGVCATDRTASSSTNRLCFRESSTTSRMRTALRTEFVFPLWMFSFPLTAVVFVLLLQNEKPLGHSASRSSNISKVSKAQTNGVSEREKKNEWMNDAWPSSTSEKETSKNMKDGREAARWRQEIDRTDSGAAEWEQLIVNLPLSRTAPAQSAAALWSTAGEQTRPQKPRLLRSWLRVRQAQRPLLLSSVPLFSPSALHGSPGLRRHQMQLQGFMIVLLSLLKDKPFTRANRCQGPFISAAGKKVGSTSNFIISEAESCRRLLIIPF